MMEMNDSRGVDGLGIRSSPSLICEEETGHSEGKWSGTKRVTSPSYSHSTNSLLSSHQRKRRSNNNRS